MNCFVVGQERILHCVELPRPKVTQNYRMPRKRPSGLDWVTEGSEVQVEDSRGHWYLATVEEVDDDQRGGVEAVYCRNAVEL